MEFFSFSALDDLFLHTAATITRITIIINIISPITNNHGNIDSNNSPAIVSNAYAMNVPTPQHIIHFLTKKLHPSSAGMYSVKDGFCHLIQIDWRLICGKVAHQSKEDEY